MYVDSNMEVAPGGGPFGAAEQRKHYGEARRRLLEAQPKPAPEVPPPVLELPPVWLPERAPNPGFVLSRILDEVGEAHEFSRADLQSERRLKKLVIARHEYFYRAYCETKRSMPAIGRLCGKDHTTVLYGIRAHAMRHGLPLPRGMAWGRRF